MGLVLIKLVIMQTLRKSIIIYLYFIIKNAQSTSRIDALVDTKVGLIRGLQATDGDYAMFMGIPYAMVEDSNPFGPSVPVPHFNETFEAYDDSAICPQMNAERTFAIGGLDCLHLNVYVPNTASSENRLPVLVWIYGGAFSVGHSGRNPYSPSNLVRHDVILVTLNYRLGPYGFMCLDTPKVPGNQGLKDQLLALKWVNDNIEAFGGDANEITIFGESAGGVSVDLHLYYSEEKLFNKVILQSGSALCPWTIEETDYLMPIKIAKRIGFESDDVDECLLFLSTTNPELIIVASTELNFNYSPCVEKEFENVKQFIGEHPLNRDIQKVKDFAILIGHNDEESLGMLNEILDAPEKIFHQNLVNYFNFENDELNAMEKIVRNYYIGDETVIESNIMSVLDFSSDFTNNHPTVRSVNHYLENGAASVFFYVFSYNGGQQFSIIEPNIYNITKQGASHMDELAYLFYQTHANENPKIEDQVMIDSISTLWTNFAKTGNPTPNESELLPLTWTPVTSDSMTYLSIGSEIEVKRRPFHARMTFWDLFYKLNKKAQKGYEDD